MFQHWNRQQLSCWNFLHQWCAVHFNWKIATSRHGATGLHMSANLLVLTLHFKLLGHHIENKIRKKSKWRNGKNVSGVKKFERLRIFYDSLGCINRLQIRIYNLKVRITGRLTFFLSFFISQNFFYFFILMISFFIANYLKDCRLCSINSYVECKMCQK